MNDLVTATLEELRRYRGLVEQFQAALAVAVPSPQATPREYRCTCGHLAECHPLNAHDERVCRAADCLCCEFVEEAR